MGKQKVCDATGGTNNVQKIVLQVVSGECYQAHGDFCEEYRAELPAKLQALGFTLVDGHGREVPRKRIKPEPAAVSTQKPSAEKPVQPEGPADLSSLSQKPGQPTSENLSGNTTSKNVVKAQEAAAEVLEKPEKPKEKRPPTGKS